MAIGSFPVTYELPARELAKRLTEAGVEKEWSETLFSFEAVVIWREWFRARYGELTELRPHSNPDDPPDLELIFDHGSVAVEHRVFQPHPMGHAEGIARKLNPGGGRTIPSPSLQYTREDLELMAFSRSSAPFANMAADHQAMLLDLFQAVSRKAISDKWEILCITDKATIADAEPEWLAGRLDEAMQSGHFASLADRPIIFFTPQTDRQYFSAILRAGSPLEAIRDGLPTVLRQPGSFA